MKGIDRSVEAPSHASTSSLLLFTFVSLAAETQTRELSRFGRPAPAKPWQSRAPPPGDEASEEGRRVTAACPMSCGIEG